MFQFFPPTSLQNLPSPDHHSVVLWASCERLGLSADGTTVQGQLHSAVYSARFSGSVQLLTSTYKLSLPSKVLIFASRSLQV